MMNKHRFQNTAALLLSLFLLAAPAVEAAPGDFDETFGYGGAAQSYTAFNLMSVNPIEPQLCCAFAQQPDGKLLVAGASNASSPRLVLRRFNSNGTPDTSFGLNGDAVAAVSPLKPVYGVPTAMKVQALGKIVVAGYTLAADGMQTFTVWRFDGTGTLDTTFGGDGIVTRAGKFAQSVATVRANLYVAASNHRVYCIDGDGGACAGFGLSGYIDVLNAYKIAYQSATGKLIVAGNGVVRRYSLNGELDTSFGENGTANICIPSCANCWIMSTDLALQGNGKIVVATNIALTVPAGYYFNVARLDADGAADNSFGGDGCIGDGSPYPPFAFQGFQRSLKVQADGKIVTLEGGNGNTGNWRVLRFNADGSPDTGFAAGGTIARNQGLLVQPSDGKIVTLGSNYDGPTQTLRDFYLARYLP